MINYREIDTLINQVEKLKEENKCHKQMLYNITERNDELEKLFDKINTFFNKENNVTLRFEDMYFVKCCPWCQGAMDMHKARCPLQKLKFEIMKTTKQTKGF